MKFVRHDSLKLLKPVLQQVITEFFEKARDHLLRKGHRADYLIDVICEDVSAWDDVLTQPWAESWTSLVDKRGNFDVLAVFLAEGKDLESTWLRVFRLGCQQYLRELEHGGLLYLHFSLGLPDPAERMRYALKLADELFAVEDNEFLHRVEPLQGLSTLTAKKDEAFRSYFGDTQYNDRNQKGLGKEQIETLLGDTPFNAGNLDVAVECLLRENEPSILNLDQKRIASRIESALIPMVYNLGYRLKSRGASVAEICRMVSVNIDALLKYVEAEPPFKAGLKQQILINLFSPFGGDLDRLNATAEKLQGVLDPVLNDAPEASLFNDTLCGPVRLFGGWHSVKFFERGAKVIDFYKDSETPLSFDVSMRGLLAKQPEIVTLLTAHDANGYSAQVEMALVGEAPEIEIPEHLLAFLLRPKTLRLYCDPALIKLIDLASDHFKRQGSISGYSVAGFMAIGDIFKERRHLRDQMLELLVDKELLTKDMFAWFGFGHRELKLVGRSATPGLKQYVLQDELGL